MDKLRAAGWCLVAACLSETACERPQPVSPPPPPAPPSASASVLSPPPSPSEAHASPAASASAASATPTPPVAVVRYTGMATPESVLYDGTEDRYLVSNIHGKPWEADNNGFISVLSPDGAVTQARWIEGGKNQVKLDAPKGMAIANGVLYVSDITTVRMFDAKSGAPKGEIKIPGTTFLNDVAVSPDGKIYVSDTGAKGGAKGLEPSGTDAVYVIEKGKAKPVAKGKELGQPNGLAVVSNGVVVVTFGGNLVYRLDEKGAMQEVTKLPKGVLDGVVALPQGDLLVSSWEGSAVYRGKLGGAFEPIFADQKSPADIGFDSKRNRVLLPHFTEDAVEAYDLPQKP